MFRSISLYINIDIEHWDTWLRRNLVSMQNYLARGYFIGGGGAGGSSRALNMFTKEDVLVCFWDFNTYFPKAFIGNINSSEILTPHPLPHYPPVSSTPHPSEMLYSTLQTKATCVSQPSLISSTCRSDGFKMM
mgnify:CR=1 FL=1